MLLDAKHKPWALVFAGLCAAATAAYVPYHLAALNGPSGGSWPGLAFGIASFLLMLFAGLLGARRKFPAWRLGRPERWMRGHLWLGLLTVPLAFFHAGFRFGGTLTVVLMVLLLVVAVSGLFGLVLQQILPRMMMARVPMETVYEQIDSVLAQLRTEADVRVAAVAGPLDPGAPPGKPAVEGSAPLKEFYLGRVRPFLAGVSRGSELATGARGASAFLAMRPLLPPALHETLNDLEIICEERRQLLVQARLHRWLHGWLFVHVPVSYALLLLAAVHAFMSVKY